MSYGFREWIMYYTYLNIQNFTISFYCILSWNNQETAVSDLQDLALLSGRKNICVSFITFFPHMSTVIMQQHCFQKFYQRKSGGCTNTTHSGITYSILTVCFILNVNCFSWGNLKVGFCVFCQNSCIFWQILVWKKSWMHNCFSLDKL